ncbi:cytochrome P450 3A14-like [Ixodes scapularis]
MYAVAALFTVLIILGIILLSFYNGDVPMLVVRDFEFLEYVFVKNFSNFTGRGVTMRTDQMHPVVGRGLIHVKGSEWKNIRSCITSGFTGLKIKLMMDHFTKVGDVFMDVLGEIADQGKEVNMLEPFQRLMMDYIGRAAFGIDTSFQKDLKNPFFLTAQRTVKEIMTGPFHMLAQSHRCGVRGAGIDADILGFETSATALSFITYALGKHPDVQEKVRQEVKEALNEGGSLDYETVTKKLKYVTQVIDEAMRIWPPALTFTTRQAKEDFEYQGIKYKAGTSIMSPPFVIHMDERFFPDPTKFDPDRCGEPCRLYGFRDDASASLCFSSCFISEASPL